MAQYIWFETSTSTPTPSTTPYRSTPLAQRLWLNTSGSIPLGQHLWPSIKGLIPLAQPDGSMPMVRHPWFDTYASTPTPPATHLRSTPTAQRHCLNASDSTSFAHHQRLNPFAATITSITQKHTLWFDTYASTTTPPATHFSKGLIHSAPHKLV